VQSQGVSAQLHRARSYLVEGPTSLGARSRARRWGLFTSLFPHLEDMSVVDLGGTVETWLRAPVRPRQVLVLNLEDQPAETPDWITTAKADVCRLPDSLRDRHDLAFSNAVIEHVGGHLKRVDFANTVRELADRHWVQTPYRYFPVEPHYLFPAFQFLPLTLRARLLRRWPLVHTPPSDRTGALAAALDVELLSRTDMRYLFPESRLIAERLAGITKSLVAVRT
jgi:hypothetical protein